MAIFKQELTLEEFNPEIIMNSGQVFRMTYDKKTRVYEAKSGSREVLFYFNEKDDCFDFVCENFEFWKAYFDFDTDYGRINRQILLGEDAFLKKALDVSFGMRILRQDLFETIISYMISQNNNIPRIKKSINALCDYLSDGVAFPTYEVLASVPEAELSALAGLGYRAEYISLFCKGLAGGEFSLEDYHGLTYEVALEALMKHKGIGPKVANCIALYGLHIMDSYPIDTWMKKIIKEDYSQYDLKSYMDYLHGNYPRMEGYIQQLQFYYKRSLK